ncbi:MAG: cyclic nucleotide-binding/CBS domain-containing protein, partial [Candidatus Sericytochromatia bacterium]
MFIKEIMKSPVIMVQSQITIKEAINKMNEFNIGSIIVGSYEKIEGIFSERDVLKKCLDLDLNKTNIDKVMTKKVITISEEE